MVYAVNGTSQQQIATGYNVQTAKAGFEKVQQNQPVLVVGKVTKAKEAEYQFPYKPNELIGVFGDRKQYRVTTTEYNRNVEEKNHPEDRLDPKDSKNPKNQKKMVDLVVYVNSEWVLTKIWSQPNKKQVFEAVQQAIAKNNFTDGKSKKINITIIALPKGQRGDGTGQHILTNDINLSAGNSSFNDDGIQRTLGQKIAARGGVPFQEIKMTK